MKEILRKKILQKRRLLSNTKKKILDKKIQKQLTRLVLFQKTRTIFLYISKEDEVDTRDILLLLLKKKKKVVVPKIHTKKPHLHLVHLKEIQHLKRGKFGILEPKSHHPKVYPVNIDLAIVPGIAFDLSGHRIGYGKGYYDRILKKIQTPKVGLAYEFQIVDKIPVRRYDVPVDVIITDKKTYVCSPKR